MNHQLIYTTCRKGVVGSGAGFQIYSYTENMEASDLTDIERRLCTYRPPDLPGLPLSPTDAELCLFPLKFKYTALTSGRMCLNQTAYAGREYMEPTGRYGNYVAHSVVLEKEPPLYPIEYYNAPFFNKVLSFDAVNSEKAPAYLPSVQLEVNDDRPVCISSVKNFVSLQNADYLKDIVYMTLDAMSEQRPLCFSNEDDKNSHLWIGTVSMLFPRELVRGLTFSTYEYDPLESTSKLNGCLIEGTRFRDTSHAGAVLTHKRKTRTSPDDPEFSDYIVTAYFEEEKRKGFHDFLRSIKWTELSRRIVPVYNLYIIKTIGANHLRPEILSECIKILEEIHSKMDTRSLEGIIINILESDKCTDDVFSIIYTNVGASVRSSDAAAVAFAKAATSRLRAANTDELKSLKIHLDAFVNGIKRGNVDLSKAVFPVAAYVLLSHTRKVPEDLAPLKDAILTVQKGLSDEMMGALERLIATDTESLSEYLFGNHPLDPRLRERLKESFARKMENMSPSDVRVIIKNAVEYKKYDDAALLFSKCSNRSDFDQFATDYLKLVNSFPDKRYETDAINICIKYATSHKPFFAHLFEYMRINGVRVTDEVFIRCVESFNNALDVGLPPPSHDVAAITSIMSMCNNNYDKLPERRCKKICALDIGYKLASGTVPQGYPKNMLPKNDEEYALDGLCRWIVYGGISKGAGEKWFLFYLGMFKDRPQEAIAPISHSVEDMELEQVAGYLVALVLNKYDESHIKNEFSTVQRNLKGREVSKVTKIMRKSNEQAVENAVKKYLAEEEPESDDKRAPWDGGKKEDPPKSRQGQVSDDKKRGKEEEEKKDRFKFFGKK